MKFESNWCTAELSDAYTAEANANCVDIFDPREIGVLQLSAYRKEEGGVTRDDLLELASDEASQNQLTEITSNQFRSFTYEYADDEFYRRRWWLASGER